jgi:hypothetical protein
MVQMDAVKQVISAQRHPSSAYKTARLKGLVMMTEVVDNLTNEFYGEVVQA